MAVAEVRDKGLADPDGGPVVRLECHIDLTCGYGGNIERKLTFGLASFFSLSQDRMVARNELISDSRLFFSGQRTVGLSML